MPYNFVFMGVFTGFWRLSFLIVLDSLLLDPEQTLPQLLSGDVRLPLCYG